MTWRKTYNQKEIVTENKEDNKEDNKDRKTAER